MSFANQKSLFDLNHRTSCTHNFSWLFGASCANRGKFVWLQNAKWLKLPASHVFGNVKFTFQLPIITNLHRHPTSPLTALIAQLHYVHWYAFYVHWWIWLWCLFVLCCGTITLSAPKKSSTMAAKVLWETPEESTKKKGGRQSFDARRSTVK